ncbi:Csu type fimbrial protein [Sphingomonas glacialis]|uniref:Csu type fimbrial protein n=1 Tax=Sphingomonas glacialis TaxID=658225 RepID=UPI0013868238|nr:spore coat U domain-containing protein [Sphingomonas glacialis]
MKWLRTLAALIILASLSGTAGAACTISVVSANFGSYSGSALDPGAVPVTISCASGEAYDVGLSAGMGQGATVSSRKLTGPGGAVLAYTLFQDPGRSIVWGNTSGTNSETGTGTDSEQILNMYPRLAAGQFIAPGTYTDTVTARVSSSSTETTTFTITAIVQAACTVESQSLSFGGYAGLETDGVAVVTVTCTNTTTYNLGLSVGDGNGATITTRRMTGPSSATLDYQLFQDSGRTTNWGDTVGADTMAGTGTGSAQSLSISGRIPSAQWVRPGSYSDVVIATVSY